MMTAAMEKKNNCQTKENEMQEQLDEKKITKPLVVLHPGGHLQRDPPESPQKEVQSIVRDNT
jgi:hypothetical protein